MDLEDVYQQTMHLKLTDSVLKAWNKKGIFAGVFRDLARAFHCQSWAFATEITILCCERHNLLIGLSYHRKQRVEF